MFIFNFYKWLLNLLGFKQKFASYKEDEFTFNYNMRHILGILSILAIITWFVFGSMQANDKDSCKIQSVAEFIITAPYAIGCNLFKKRFDIKLN